MGVFQKKSSKWGSSKNTTTLINFSSPTLPEVLFKFIKLYKKKFGKKLPAISQVKRVFSLKDDNQFRLAEGGWTRLEPG